MQMTRPLWCSEGAGRGIRNATSRTHRRQRTWLSRSNAMVRPTKFEIREHATEPALELSVTGELDMNTVELLTTHVERSLADGPRALRLDLAELGFMDSSGLRFLIDLYDRS